MPDNKDKTQIPRIRKAPVLFGLTAYVFLYMMNTYSGPSIILLTPILAPVAVSLGMNLIQFGQVMVINLTIGLLTPPVGTAAFVASNISGVPIGKLFRSLIPFWGIMLFVLMLVT